MARKLMTMKERNFLGSSFDEVSEKNEAKCRSRAGKWLLRAQSFGSTAKFGKTKRFFDDIIKKCDNDNNRVTDEKLKHDTIVDEYKQLMEWRRVQRARLNYRNTSYNVHKWRDLTNRR